MKTNMELVLAEPNYTPSAQNVPTSLEMETTVSVLKRLSTIFIL